MASKGAKKEKRTRKNRSGGIADYRCYSLLCVEMANRGPKDRPWRGGRGGVSQKKLASEAYRAIGGIAQNITHTHTKLGLGFHPCTGPGNPVHA